MKITTDARYFPYLLAVISMQHSNFNKQRFFEELVADFKKEFGPIKVSPSKLANYLNWSLYTRLSEGQTPTAIGLSEPPEQLLSDTTETEMEIDSAASFLFGYMERVQAQIILRQRIWVKETFEAVGIQALLDRLREKYGESEEGCDGYEVVEKFVLLIGYIISRNLTNSFCLFEKDFYFVDPITNLQSDGTRLTVRRVNSVSHILFCLKKYLLGAHNPKDFLQELVILLGAGYNSVSVTEGQLVNETLRKIPALLFPALGSFRDELLIDTYFSVHGFNQFIGVPEERIQEWYESAKVAKELYNKDLVSAPETIH